MRSKSIVLVLLVSIVLASCAPATDAVETKTDTPAATLTLISSTPTNVPATATKENTPTTLPPTEIPDLTLMTLEQLKTINWDTVPRVTPEEYAALLEKPLAFPIEFDDSTPPARATLSSTSKDGADINFGIQPGVNFFPERAVVLTIGKYEYQVLMSQAVVSETDSTGATHNVLYSVNLCFAHAVPGKSNWEAQNMTLANVIDIRIAIQGDTVMQLNKDYHTPLLEQVPARKALRDGIISAETKYILLWVRDVFPWNPGG